MFEEESTAVLWDIMAILPIKMDYREGQEQEKFVASKYSNKTSVAWFKWAVNVYLCL